MNWMVTIVSFTIFYSGVVMAIEEPKYSVVSKTEAFEVRDYEPVLIAQTYVESEFEEAGNQAFKILADYIFGNNTTNTKIDMTAPVAQSKSEKIAMTAPVNLTKSEKGYLVSFTMPSKFTRQTLPTPNDVRVQIVEVPSRKVAVYRYSGSWSQSRYQTKLAEFQQALLAEGVKTVGEPVLARFNSPFQLWFLRRNEIWLELAP